MGWVGMLTFGSICTPIQKKFFYATLHYTMRLTESGVGWSGMGEGSTRTGNKRVLLESALLDCGFGLMRKTRHGVSTSVHYLSS